MSTETSYNFKKELINLVPQLRAFGYSLCNNKAVADDLAQEALAKAWKARESFQLGTNLRAWVFRILRNEFYSLKRRDWRSQPYDPELAEQTLVASDRPEAALELKELRHALAQLKDEQREAVILVGAGGLSYEEAAEICNCAIGTIKSRLSRGRQNLETILSSKDMLAGHSGSKDKASEAMTLIMREVVKRQKESAK